MKPKKIYTVSTFIFKSLAEAEKQIKKWNDQHDLDGETKVFEITGKVYEPVLKLQPTKLK